MAIHSQLVHRSDRGGYGRKYGNMLAKALDAIGDSHALQIIREHSIFSSYSVKLLKHRLENNEMQYVLQNTTAHFDGSFTSSSSNNGQEWFRCQRMRILEMMKEYNETDEISTKKYRL